MVSVIYIACYKSVFKKWFFKYKIKKAISHIKDEDEDWGGKAKRELMEIISDIKACLLYTSDAADEDISV